MHALGGDSNPQPPAARHKSSSVRRAPAQGITVHTPGAAGGIKELLPAEHVAWCWPTALSELEPTVPVSLPLGVAMSQVPQSDALGMDWLWTPGKWFHPPILSFLLCVMGPVPPPPQGC